MCQTKGKENGQKGSSKDMLSFMYVNCLLGPCCMFKLKLDRNELQSYTFSRFILGSWLALFIALIIFYGVVITLHGRLV